MMVQPTTPGTQPRIYDKNGKGWYFQFDDDNKMSYQYHLDHLNLKYQFNTYHLTHCECNKEGNR